MEARNNLIFQLVKTEGKVGGREREREDQTEA